MIIKGFFFFYIKQKEFKHSDVISSLKFFNEGPAAARHRVLIHISQLWLLERFIACRQYLKTFIKQASVPSAQHH